MFGIFRKRLTTDEVIAFLQRPDAFTLESNGEYDTCVAVMVLKSCALNIAQHGRAGQVGQVVEYLEPEEQELFRTMFAGLFPVS